MKKHFKQILSLFLCALVIMGTFTMSKRPEAEAAGSDYNTSKTLTSASPDDRAQADILHMDRTVKENTSGGFDVTLTSYLDDLASTSVPMDVVFVMDQSTSMEKDHKQEVVETIQLVLGMLQSTGGKHRIGFVTYGTGVYSSTTDSLISITDAQNHDFSNYLNLLGAGTHTDAAMEKAQSLLSSGNDEKRTQTCIVLTDGVPTSILLLDTAYSKTAANRALNTASEMKASGVSIYVLKLSAAALEESVAQEFCKRLSSYCNADVKNMDDSLDGKTNPPSSGWVYNAAEKTDLTKAISAAIAKSKLYPFVLNSSAVTQDVVTPYFKISNASCKIQIANYDSSKKLTSWSDNGSLSAAINGQRVYVTGFDYIARAVSPYNDQSARLVITYHIDPITDFFGGNSIPTITEGEISVGEYTSGGSGLYCNGVFLKPFRNIPVNVELRNPAFRMNGSDVKSGDKKSFNIDPWNYLHETDFDNYYNIPDINGNTNVVKYFDGIKNKFVNVTATGEVALSSANRSTETTLFKSTGSEIKVKSKNGNAYAGYKITSETDDKFTVTYQFVPANAFNKESSVGKPATTKTATGTCKVCAKWNYIATFKFDENVPSGVTAPGNVDCGYTEYEYANKNDKNSARIPKAPKKIEDVNKNKSYCKYLEGDTDSSGVYVFSGFVLKNKSIDNTTGTVTYNYVGSWNDNPDAVTCVEVYLQDDTTPFDESGNVNYTLHKEFLVQKPINEIYYRQIKACDAEDYQFYDSRNGDYIYNVYDKYKLSVIYDDYGFDQYVLNDDEETKVMATASVRLCPTCGQMTDLDEFEALSAYCYNCSKYISIKDALHYADYKFEYDLTKKDVAERTYRMYFSRVEHSVNTTVTFNDNPGATKTYSYSTLTGCNLYDENGNPKIAYDENGDYRADYAAAVFTDDYDLIECTPFYDCTNARFPILYYHDAFEVADYDCLCGYLEYPDCYFIFDGNYGYMPAYDINLTVEMTRIKYDLTVTKQWDSTVSQKDVQNCIFGLYEVNEIDGKRDYNLICRFAIGVDEFEYKNGILTASKTIKDLCAGNEYVLEEETWSYKTESDWYRGAENETVVYGVSHETIEKICRNRNDSNWTHAPAAEKGVRNQLSSDKSSIVATNIKKNVKAGKG